MTYYEAQRRLDRAARKHLIDTLRKVGNERAALLADDLKADMKRADGKE